MRIERTRILVLNYNGCPLLRECLPSVVEAARSSAVPCPVTVVDNGSTDDSLEALAAGWPEVDVIHHTNDGLASFNDVLAVLEEPVVLLLNNDVRLAPDAVGPLLEAFEACPDALFTAPQCWTFDGREYEGMRTRVRSRYGMAQGLSRVPGHERLVDQPDLTAAAGPVLAVDRRRFLELGGFDPIFQPGRIEDLDLGFRGWMRGWKGYYVPASRADHKGFGSFEPTFGRTGCDRLAARNTLLFAWSNYAGRRLYAHLAWLPLRAAYALARRRPGFALALRDALTRLRPALANRRMRAVGGADWVRRQEAFFYCFRW